MVATTGYELVVEQRVQDRRVDRLDVADETEVGVSGRRADETRVLAGHADGQRPVHVDRSDQLRVDLTDQHHADDVDRLAIGDPQAVAELALLAEAAHQVADLRTATVHDHGPHADLAHQHDVFGEQGERIVLRRTGQRIAAVLDDDDLVGETTDVRERLDECRGAVCRRSTCHGNRPTA